MKYSIRGTVYMVDDSVLVNLFNNYTLWRLHIGKSLPNYLIDNTDARYTFEVWVSSLEDKNELWEELRLLIDENGEFIEWHECFHDEDTSQLCIPVEEYRG